MKKSVFFVFGLWVILTVQAIAQDAVFKEFKTLVKQGNSKELTKYIAPNVTIKILGDEANYNKTQAEMVLKDFFKKYPPMEYEGIHQGQSKEGGLYYAVGKYTHSKGNLRVYILVKQLQGNFLIDTLDFSE